MRKAAAIILAISLLAVLTTGCGKKNTAGKTEEELFSFEKNGSVTVTSVESFDQDYYSSAELSDMADSEISAYNASNGNDAVRKKKLAVKEGHAELICVYRTAEDYCRFNEERLYYGTVGGASMSSVDLTPLLGQKELPRGKNALTSEDLDRMENDPMIVMFGPARVRTERRIRYCTGNVQPVDDRNAVISDTASESNPALIILHQ